MSKRRKYLAAVETKVALEKLRGDQTLGEVLVCYNVHPIRITNWKKKARKGVVDMFSGDGRRRDVEPETGIKELHAKIG